MIPEAERLNIKVGVRFHPPVVLKSSWIDPFMEVIEKTKTKNFGFVLDMGIFVRRPPRVLKRWTIRHGANPALADYVDMAYQNNQDMDVTMAEVKKMGDRTPISDGFGAPMATAIISLRDILKFSQYIFHSHAKFYEMTDELQEYSIPYGEIVSVLKEANFSGYLCSEYEGQRHINDYMESDAVDQVRRQHVMLRKLLHET